MSTTGKPSLEEDLVDLVELDSKLCRKLEEDFTDHAKKDKMQVFLRIRPFKQEELENEGNQHCLTIEDDKTVLLRPPLDPSVSKKLRDSMRIHQRFSFSYVFGPEFDQKDFFDLAVLPMVKDSLRGETCLVFAYGATNSGKSYTIQGTSSQPGIIPRALAVIFKSTRTSREYALDTTEIEELAELAFHDGTRHSVDDYPEPKASSADTNASDELFENSSDECLMRISRDFGKVEELLSESVREECDDIVSIWVSFAEIYNENIYDLLEPVPLGQKRRNLRLVLDRQGGRNHIKGLRYVNVHSVVEACRMLQIGKTNLHIASTKLNQQSSRSHCIFAVHMIRNKGPGQPEVNSLTFCDLAGLERVAKTQNTGSRLKEAGNINTSLLVLGRCIQAIRDRHVVPFRDSKLTRLLQGYLTEYGKASMVVNVGQSSEMFNDTLHVLKFSASAKQVVSVDNLDRSKFWTSDQSSASNSSRITDLWPMARQRWSEFSKNKGVSKASIATVQEEVLEESAAEESSCNLQEPSDVQDLIDIIWDLEKKLQDVLREKMMQETEIRKEVCEEFDKMMDDMDKRHREMIKSTEERTEELMNRRLSLMKKSLIAKYEREYGEEEEDSFESSGTQSEESMADCSTNVDLSKEMDPGTVETKDASVRDCRSVYETPMSKHEEIGSVDRRVLGQERKALLEDNARLTREKVGLVAECKAMQKELEQIKGQSSQLVTERLSLVKESELLQRENVQLLKENARLSTELSVLEKRVEATTKVNCTLELEVASLQKVYETLREEKAQLEKTLKTQKKEEENLRKNICSMEKNVTTLQELCQKQDLEKEQLHFENEQLKENSEHKNLSLEIERLKEVNSTMAKTHEHDIDDLNEQIKKLNDKVASLESELQYAKTDDFKQPKKMNTRGRRKATPADDKTIPKRSRKVEEPVSTIPKEEVLVPTSQQVGLRSPLLAIGDAIRQSPTFKAMEAAMSRVIDKFTASPAAPQRRTRRKLYNKENSDLISEVSTDIESAPKASIPAVAAKRSSRNLRKKK